MLKFRTQKNKKGSQWWKSSRKRRSRAQGYAPGGNGENGGTGTTTAQGQQYRKVKGGRQYCGGLGKPQGNMLFDG